MFNKVNILWVWSGANARSSPAEDSESADRSGFFINGIVWILVDLSGYRNTPLNDMWCAVSWAEAGRKDEFCVRDVLGQDPFLG